MFDDLINALESLDGRQIRVEIPCDGEGYLDRVCAAEDCATRFKVLAEDWKAKVPDEAAWCPNCGRSREPSEFDTPEQRAHVHAVGGYEVERAIHNGLTSSARRNNATQHRRRNRGPLSLSIEMKVDSPPPVAPPPMDPWNEMKTKHTCSACACHFALVGAWFYCPACGSHDPVSTFTQSIAGIRNAMNMLDQLLNAATDEDLAADLRRRTCEASIGGLVTSFQVVLDAIYTSIPSSKPAGQNAFQNLDRGSKLWVALGGTDFESLLGPTDFARANLFFQRRHAFQHRDGMVDQRYIDLSGDNSFRLGQRLVVQVPDVIDLCDYVEALVNAVLAEKQAKGW